jgi:hypothetical protein
MLWKSSGSSAAASSAAAAGAANVAPPFFPATHLMRQQTPVVAWHRDLFEQKRYFNDICQKWHSMTSGFLHKSIAS